MENCNFSVAILASSRMVVTSPSTQVSSFLATQEKSYLKSRSSYQSQHASIFFFKNFIFRAQGDSTGVEVLGLHAVDTSLILITPYGFLSIISEP